VLVVARAGAQSLRGLDCPQAGPFIQGSERLPEGSPEFRQRIPLILSLHDQLRVSQLAQPVVEDARGHAVAAFSQCTSTYRTFT
jgi:hypothetical protein